MRPVQLLLIALPLLACSACATQNAGDPNANPATKPTTSTAFTPTPTIDTTHATPGGSPVSGTGTTPTANP